MPAPVSSLIPVADALTARDVRPGQVVPVAIWEVLSTVPLQDTTARRQAARVAASATMASTTGWLLAASATPLLLAGPDVGQGSAPERRHRSGGSGLSDLEASSIDCWGGSPGRLRRS